MKAKVIKTGEIVDVYHESQHGQVSNIYKESVLVNGRMWSEDELDFCVKASKVPEKIYINPNLENRTWLIGKGDISFIEYTRTDAFIEKAVVWISNNCYIPHSTLEAFRNYMEGE